MSVYFIRNTLTGNVKIGWTERPVRNRLKGLQTGCDGELELLLEIAKGTKKTEAFLHAKFGEYRLRGEWFFLAPAIARFVKRYTASPEDWVPRALLDAVKGIPWGCACVPTSPVCCAYCQAVRKKRALQENQRFAKREFLAKLREIESRAEIESRRGPLPEDVAEKIAVLRAKARAMSGS